MRRLACLCGLLLPLMLRGSAPPVPLDPGPAKPEHAWPTVAAAQPTASPTEFRAYPDPGQLMDHAVQELKGAMAQPATPRNRSLAHVDLTRRLRLAFASTPEWHISRLGHGSSCIPLFSLRW